MRISANDIKSGNILDYEGELWIVAKNPELVGNHIRNNV